MNSRIKQIKTQVAERSSSGQHIISDNQSNTGCCVNNGSISLDANISKRYNESEARRVFEEAIKNHDNELPESDESLTSDLENSISQFNMEHEGTNTVYTSMPLKDFTRTWLDTFKLNTVKTSSLARLEVSYNALLPYSIANMPIGDITAMDIQRYVNELVEKGYAINTIKKQLRIITSPLKLAAGMRQIPTDPTYGVRLPKEERLKKQTKEIVPYTDEEQARLWKEIDQWEHPAVLAIGFILETGLRAGEAMALRWEKVDIPRKRIRVDATITDPFAKTRAAYQNSTKSRASNRTVPLTPRAISLLERLLALRKNESEWVFPSLTTWVSYQNLSKHLKSVCRRAGIPYRGVHCLRHTFATNCYYRHVDVKILAQLMGHSDSRITTDIYVRLRGDGFDDLYNALVS